MTKIRHVSLDVWNTLIRSNPEFGIRRAALLAEITGTDLNAAKAAIKRTKAASDYAAEEHGTSLPSIKIYHHLLEQLECNIGKAERLKFEMERLFTLYPPTFSDENVAALRKLDENGVTYSILSNTSFITGLWLYDVVFRPRDLSFSFAMFSDLYGIAKPHSSFYAQMLEKVRGLHPDIEDAAIVHVGDDASTDGLGARLAGIRDHVISGADAFPQAIDAIIAQ